MGQTRAGRTRGVLDAARRGYCGELPERYLDYPVSFRLPFERALAPLLAAARQVLDVGGGRTPTVVPADRPAGCWYVGLDELRSELELAPAGSYDEIVAGDITGTDRSLEERFDLIVSFQALEHVSDLERALANMFLYLRPHGKLLVQLSGRFSVYALISRITPPPLARQIQRRLYQRDPDTVFRARYDRCYFRSLERMMRSWCQAEITPLWLAMPYFRFSRLLASAYLFYEEWARESGWVNLAPYYLIEGRK
ncbi:MAG: class I SAM-dependent methyltransferase [Actinomycetota bacterium]|nr:class I SAM-dependent methyltransferase [Actinomycetota bacterium]